MAAPGYTDVDKKEDLNVLHGMGYAQELSRSMSRFSNFAISFSIICILSGGINSFAQATSSIGGAGAGIGWIVGCAVSGFFALAMAQIASAFPTGRRPLPLVVDPRQSLHRLAYSLAQPVRPDHRARRDQYRHRVLLCGNVRKLVWHHRHSWREFGFVAFITVLQALFNHFGIKLTAMLTDASGFLILGATAVLIVACLVFARQSTSRDFGPSPTTRVMPAAAFSRRPIP